MSDSFWKAIATSVIWVMAFVSILMGSIFVAPTLGEEFLGFIFMVMVGAVVTSGFVWNWGQSGSGNKQQREQRGSKHKNIDDEYYDLYFDRTGKRKNEDRLSNALAKLSDEQLLRLRNGIQQGEIDENDLEDALEELLANDDR